MAKKEGGATPTVVEAESPPAGVVCTRGDRQEDPFTLIVYTSVPTPIEGEIADGSWLDCQIKAGLLKVV